MPDSKAKRDWDAANTRQIKMKLNANTDADILQWLEAQTSKQGAIKAAIRSQIKETHPPRK